MVKLVDSMGTKYIHMGYYKELQDLLEGELKGQEIDLADARLPRDTWELVQTLGVRGTCSFCDSMDSKRDRILKENRRRYLEEQNTQYAELHIPPAMEYMEKYLDSYEPGKTYRVLSKTNQFAAAWVILVQAARPDITIDLYTLTTTVFGLIKRNLPVSSYPVGEPVYYLTGTAFDIEENPTIDFIRRESCVPVEFGQQCLYKQPYIDRWERCLNVIEAIVNREINPTVRHIADFL